MNEMLHAIGLVLMTGLPAQEHAAALRVDLGKHCAVHAGRGESEEIGGRQQKMRFDAGAAVFADRGSRVTFGPHRALGVDSKRSFTLECEIKTRPGRFATPLMCRERGRVHYSLVLGRTPGTIAFECWNWSRESARSHTRIDDGKWHRIQASYDASLGCIALFVDGKLESLVRVRSSFDGSKAPQLRLGNNIGTDQQFTGSLREIRVVRTVPETLRNSGQLVEKTRVLSDNRVRDSLRAWLRDMRQPRPPLPISADAWKRRAASIRARVQDTLGLWPPPLSGERLDGARSPVMGAHSATATDFARYAPELPLAVKRGGTIVRNRYELRRIYWQTFAGYHASGWLYLPKRDGKLPAVLCPHGHWRHGARHPVVQSRCIELAKLGYVVLAVDSIHLYEERVGLTPLSVMIWNNLRGLELLRGLPQVDADRIGITGASGGGQQTYYMTGLATGLSAAVPAVMTCHFSEILLHDHVHCACNFVARQIEAADVPEMSAAFAPRPQLFLSVTGDWTKRFPRQGFPPIRAIYDLFDAGEVVASKQWDHGHDYSRPMRNAMYAFFERHLKGVAKPNPEIENKAPETEPVAALGELDLPNVARDSRAIVREFMQRLAIPPLADRRPDRERIRRRLEDLFLQAEWRPNAGDRARRVRRLKLMDRELEAWIIPAEPTVELAALWIPPRAKRENPRIAIVTSQTGKSGVLAARRPWIDALDRLGYGILLLDIRYTGELDHGIRWRDAYGRIFGRDEGILAVRDLRRAIEALPVISAVTKPNPVLLAFDTTGASALFAAALTRGVAGVVLPELGNPYRRAGRRPAVGRILLHGDLPDAFLLASGGFVFAGKCDPNDYRVASADAKRLLVYEEPLTPPSLDVATSLFRR